MRTGRFERSLSALTAAGALVTAAEIFFRARQRQLRQQDDVAAGRARAVGAAAGVAGFFSRRMAKTALPVASAAIVANGLQGTYLHARGIAQKPGGWSNARYNIEMGPPVLAPCWSPWSAGWACSPRSCGGSSERRPPNEARPARFRPGPPPPAAHGPVPRLRRHEPGPALGPGHRGAGRAAAGRAAASWRSSSCRSRTVPGPSSTCSRARNARAASSPASWRWSTPGWRPGRPTAGATRTCPRTAQAWRRHAGLPGRRRQAALRDHVHRRAAHGPDGPDPGGTGPEVRRLARAERRARVEPVDPVRLHGASTPTRRPGTRSASPARPTRAATRTPAWASASRSRCRDARPVPTTRCSGAGRADDGGESLTASGPATSRPGCCPTTAAGPTTGCAPTCAGSPTTTRSTWSIVGCGAGGSTLAQRLARAGWRVVGARRRAVLGSGRRLGQRRGGLAPPVLDRAAGHQRRRPGAAGLEQLRPRRRRLDGPLRRLHAALPPHRLRDVHPRRGRRRLADQLRRLRPYYEQIEQELPVAGRALALGRPARLPATGRTRSGGNGEIFLRGARALGHRPRKVGPVAIANGRFGNRPHCIYRGFCLQGCKVNAKASPLITHIPDALAHGAEIRADAMVTRVVIDEQTGRATGVHYFRDGARALPAGAAWWPWPDTRSRRRGCCCNSASARFPDGAVQRLRPGRPLRHGAGRAADGRPVRRRGADVQGAAARGELRGVLRDGPTKPLPARLLHPEHLPAAHHLCRARGGPGSLGRGAARVHARLRPLGRAGRAVRVPAPGGERGHPGRGEPTATGCRWPISPTRSATTTSSSERGRAGRSWRTSCAPPGPKR